MNAGLLPSLVNHPYFLGGGENRSGHTCRTLLVGRNVALHNNIDNVTA